MKRKDDYERIAVMLKSIDPTIDYPNDNRSKAQVVRAAMGSIEPPMDEQSMTALCECGWQGTLQDCECMSYESGGESWQRLAGRKGHHWNCPNCSETIWKYYDVIS